MARRKTRRSRRRSLSGLGSPPEMHAAQARYSSTWAVRNARMSQKLSSKGDCGRAFEALLVAAEDNGHARSHTTSAGGRRTGHGKKPGSRAASGAYRTALKAFNKYCKVGLAVRYRKRK